MFTDIRGFTTFSETRQPEEVVDILNEYLGGMTESVLDHGGTLSAYLGDGIMAVFGAPVAHEDHAERALACARDMLDKRLKAFNASMANREGGEEFKIGVGLNSGPVMVGMVGSERRLDYTVIGDVVNTCSRLEGLTKGTPHSLFIAESTLERLTTSKDDLEFVEEMPVRGREHGLKVYRDKKLGEA